MSVGPAELVRELVRGALTSVADTLSDHVRDVRPTDAASRAGLIKVSAAASAWAQTFVVCHELEAFSLDSAADRVGVR